MTDTAASSAPDAASADQPPALVWLRRDLRLADNPALDDALRRGGPVVAVWILDPQTEALGAAHRWRLEASLARLAEGMEALGARLILRRGEALPVLRALAAETGARAIRWNRLYDQTARHRDAAVKSALREDGLDVRSFNGALLHEPWEVETKTGGFYKVYTPFWRAIAERVVHEPIPAPSRWPAPDAWPVSERLADWAMAADMRRGAPALAAHARPGEAEAQDRLAEFLEDRVEHYAADRDRLDRDATSRLSDALAVGELSARQIWTAARPRRQGAKAKPVEKFMQELAWRDFAYHLLHHSPRLETGNWREEWDGFPWRDDNADAQAWTRGLTGEPLIDAAMRELWVTGTMHNRARMLVASYLTKHLMTHWRVGEAWFRDTLIDWDPASNALGWQWVAGSGPDASPFFRIFNPETQAEKFDPDGAYRRHWLKGAGAEAFHDAIPRAWGLSPGDRRPAPRISLKAGRERALTAYADLRAARDAT
ncbi:deoxyribodipyrimidine photo-lyase [Albimonas donghaensis]|uniref:Deoxyribodipyrimidine photo-lyase n=1 Tax=Albimonas donghaensis TaxID=356660 RepID=A0A1H2WG35_9RHOB|nr:deoxyribodipyrimidine photo-lyase [Albimonas donghaensis]SDW79495.1 deoxyribodipyrimidine photo-lyase [Albimonas donghaensis]